MPNISPFGQEFYRQASGSMLKLPYKTNWKVGTKMSLAPWALIFLIATGVCGFILKIPPFPQKGFITPRLL